MPRKQRAPKRRTGAALRLADFTLAEELCFLAAWAPGLAEHDIRWATWGEFIGDYEAVRDELLDMFSRPVPFAETVMRFRDTYGPRALQAATYEDIRAYAVEDGGEKVIA